MSPTLPWWARVLLWLASSEVLPESRPSLYVVRVAHEILVADTSEAGKFDAWRPSCSCGWTGTSTNEDGADLQAHQHRAQAFFAEIANEMRRPSFGEMQAGFMRGLLVRAQEAKLFTPENS